MSCIRPKLPLMAMVCLAACSLTRSGLPAQGSMDQRFESLGDRYIEEFSALSPVSATLEGDHRYDGRLDQVGAEARAEKERFLRRFLDELEAISPAELSRANQVDYAMLEHYLRADLWHQDVLQEWAWNPLIYTGLAGNAIYSLVAREFAPLENCLSCLADRLEQFPRLFTQVRGTLQPARVPKIHAETAVDQNRGILSMLDTMVNPHLDRLSGAERERLVKAAATARDAVQKQQQWLESELLPHAAGKWKRACLTFAQLSTYFVGYLEHVELRRDMERARGDNFNLKAYHDKVLSFGSPPVQFVRSLMLDNP